MAKVTLGTVSSGYGTIDALNANFQKLVTAIDNTLSRDGTSPNAMGATLDMNSNRVINLAAPVNTADAVRLVDLQSAAVVSNIPTQAGQAGKVLKTDGAALGWQTAGEVIGNETGAATDMLPYFTDGTTLDLLGPLTSVGKALLVLASYSALRTAADVPSRTEMAVQDAVVASLAIPRSNIVAKGDLVVGDANGDPIRLAVGTNGSVPVADSAQPGGYTFVKLGAGDVRQSILDAPGVFQQTHLVESAGTNRKVDFVASPTDPVVIAYAAGFGPQGAQDYVSSITSGQVECAEADPYRWCYVFSEHVSPTSHTIGQTYSPPQYGTIYGGIGNARDLLLNFEEGNGSTTLVDEYGSAWWICSGGTQVETAQSKFGTGSIRLPGSANDYVWTNVKFPDQQEGWELSFWVRFSTLPGAGTQETMVHFYGDTQYGLRVAIDNTAGTYKISYRFGTDRTSWNIVNALGSRTTWTTNTWYKIRVNCDHTIGGAFRAFVSENGATETQDLSVATNPNAATYVTTVRLGSDGPTPGNYMDGYIDAFHFTTASGSYTAETPSGSPPSVTDSRKFWFNIKKMRMYEITGPSTARGADPVMTPKNVVFLGQFYADATDTAQTAPYTTRGQHIGSWTAMSTVGGTDLTYHYLGYPSEWYKIEVEGKSLESDATNGHYVGNTIVPLFQYVTGTDDNYAMPQVGSDRLFSWVMSGDSSYSFPGGGGRFNYAPQIGAWAIRPRVTRLF